MKNTLYIFLVVISAVLAQSCAERTICPAYESAFIHDKTALDKRFSYFGEDSLPKVLEASKDRFLIIEPVSYRKKLRSLQTVAMTDIYPEVEDSVEFSDDFSLAERDLSDSLAIDSLGVNPEDSVYMISLKKEKFNTDQELYLWYLKDYLVYPDVRLMQEDELKSKQQEEKKEKRGFFKRLFGKKKKTSQDSTVFDVETNATDIPEDDVKEKKGLFNFLKKKDKKKDKAKDKDPPKNPEEENNDPSVDPSTLPGR